LLTRKANPIESIKKKPYYVEFLRQQNVYSVHTCTINTDECIKISTWDSTTSRSQWKASNILCRSKCWFL